MGSDDVSDSNRHVKSAAPQHSHQPLHSHRPSNSDTTDTTEFRQVPSTLPSNETDNILSQSNKARVRKMSPAEFQRRTTDRHHDDVLDDESLLSPSVVFSPASAQQHPDPSTFATAPTLRQRIEQQKLNAANDLIAQYESLFFSDHVDQHCTPIQRFFPSSLFDLSAPGASPILASDRPSEHVPFAVSFAEWCRNLRRSMFMKAQGARTKVWDAYDENAAPGDRYDTVYNAITEKNKAAQSNAPVILKDSDSVASSVSPPSTSSCTSASASDDSDNEPRVFIDRAFPTPSAAQFKRCQLNNGKGVWDTMGVWRCLLANSSGKFDLGSPSSPRSQLFAQFEDFIEWKSKQQSDIGMLVADQDPFDFASPAANAAVTSSIVNSLLGKEQSAAAKTQPSANAKVVGRGQVSSTVFENGKFKTVKKSQTFYDDGSVTETVEESQDQAAKAPAFPEWWNPESKFWARERDLYKQFTELIGKSTDDFMRTGANSLEKTLKLLDKAMDLESSKLQDAIKKIFPFGWKDDDDEKSNKKK
ncbi:hypothetical protein V1520DRAFT_333426 [Lipomyces starkeyi]|uniref:Uncharacterized protein n=1 Tax=Lipomyces starkeyi NRRL Y-11557 TaxID=675824 RepID=A0A1E3Q9H2_LIPST|nr:hypothetical protein LIPSTDRAFT_271200 [Lipomyces starkeyi NRRL Y-11557]